MIKITSHKNTGYGHVFNSTTFKLFSQNCLETIIEGSRFENIKPFFKKQEDPRFFSPYNVEESRYLDMIGGDAESNPYLSATNSKNTTWYGNDKVAVLQYINNAFYVSNFETEKYFKMTVSNIKDISLAVFKNGAIAYLDFTSSEVKYLPNDANFANQAGFETKLDLSALDYSANKKTIMFSDALYLLRDTGEIDKIDDQGVITLDTDEISKELIESIGAFGLCGGFQLNKRTIGVNYTHNGDSYYKQIKSIEDYGDIAVLYEPTNKLTGFFSVYNKISKELKTFDLGKEISYFFKNELNTTFQNFINSEEVVGKSYSNVDCLTYDNMGVLDVSLSLNAFYSTVPLIDFDLKTMEIDRIVGAVPYGPQQTTTKGDGAIINIDFYNKKVESMGTISQLLGNATQAGGVYITEGYLMVSPVSTSEESICYADERLKTKHPLTVSKLEFINKEIKINEDSFIYFKAMNGSVGMLLSPFLRKAFYSDTNIELTEIERMNDDGVFESINVLSYIVGQDDKGRKFRVKIPADTITKEGYFPFSILGMAQDLNGVTYETNALKIEYDNGSGYTESGDGTIPEDANTVRITKTLNDLMKGQVIESEVKMLDIDSSEYLSTAKAVTKEKFVENRKIYLEQVSLENKLIPFSSITKNEFVFGISEDKTKITVQYEIDGIQKTYDLVSALTDCNFLDVAEISQEKFVLIYNNSTDLIVNTFKEIKYSNELSPIANTTVQDAWLSTDDLGSTITDFNVDGTDVVFSISELPTTILVTLDEAKYLNKLTLKSSVSGKFVKKMKIEYSDNGGTSYTTFSTEDLPDNAGVNNTIDFGETGVKANRLKLTLIEGYDSNDVLIDSLKLERSDFNPVILIESESLETLNRLSTDDYSLDAIADVAIVYSEENNKIFANCFFKVSAITTVGPYNLEANKNNLLQYEKDLSDLSYKRVIKQDDYVFDSYSKYLKTGFLKNEDDTITMYYTSMSANSFKFEVLRTGSLDGKLVKGLLGTNCQTEEIINGGSFLVVKKEVDGIEKNSLTKFNATSGKKEIILATNGIKSVSTIFNETSEEYVFILEKEKQIMLEKYSSEMQLLDDYIISESYGEKEIIAAKTLYKNGYSLIWFDNTKSYYDTYDKNLYDVVWENLGKDNMTLEILIDSQLAGDVYDFSTMKPGEEKVVSITLNNTSDNKTIRGCEAIATGDQDLIAGVDFSINGGTTYFNKKITIGDIAPLGSVTLTQRVKALDTISPGNNKLTVQLTGTQY